ncbi:MAG: alpha/beta hydrolase [Hylemonella sp.]|uniref:alpha/beta hydrolase n=1 Tax=Hylemonella sp. TaxID=2066020 RepID=UPI0022C1CD73|nr:alpha/beta hydrolase [Hylemonella sp.]MCZ8252947.1 alpha/beta hydrolase [Hylemonella sp.]
MRDLPIPLSLRRCLRALTLLPFLLLGGCSTTALLDRLVPEDSYVARPSAAYGSDPRQQLDIYLPLASADSGARPLVVFFYGGSWSSGERSRYRFVGEALASRGVVTLVADYRLSPQVRYPAFLQDSAAAVRWAYDNAAELGADPRRIYLMGHSAGGYNAAMLALDPRWLGQVGLQPQQLAGWIGIAGPYDFLPISARAVQRAFDWPATPADSQPLVHASAAAPRTLLIAARSDTLVNPQRNTLALDQRLRQAGVEIQTHVLDRVNHATVLGALASPLNFLAPVATLVTDFVRAPPAARPLALGAK